MKKKLPAKKAPAPALIEGKYTHKFLTRLEPETGKRLEALQAHFSCKTMNGTIVQLIDGFMSLYERNKANEKSLSESRQKYSSLKYKVEAFNRTFKALTSDTDDTGEEENEEDEPLFHAADRCRSCGERFAFCDCDD